jgi:hypothetical protein
MDKLLLDQKEKIVENMKFELKFWAKLLKKNLEYSMLCLIHLSKTKSGKLLLCENQYNQRLKVILVPRGHSVVSKSFRATLTPPSYSKPRLQLGVHD